MASPRPIVPALAFYFTTRKPTRRAFDIPLGSNRIDIPAGEPRLQGHRSLHHSGCGGCHRHQSACPLRLQGNVGYAVLPDGSRRTLIRIPEWNFDWQQQYAYAAPIRLPAETRVEMEFTYDNSAANPRNPNHPAKSVTWGPGSADEMAGLHISVVPVKAADAQELTDSLWGKMMRALRGR